MTHVSFNSAAPRKHIPFKPAALAVCVGLVLMAPYPLRASSVVKLADHPTAKLTPFPTLHSTKAVGDRVYFGYGDWTAYPAVVLVSYTPGRNVFTLEHSVASDSIEFMREIDDTLYIPHCDPVHYEDFHDFSFRGPDGRWLQSAALEQEHVFDFVRSPDGIFCDSSSLLHSPDQGRTWVVEGTVPLPSWPCFYWLCVRVKNDPRLTVSVEWSRELDAWSPASPDAGAPVVVDAGTTHELVKSPAPGGDGVHWWRVKASYQAD